MFFVQRVTSALTMMYNEKDETTLMDLLIGKSKSTDSDVNNFLDNVEDEEASEIIGNPD